MFVVMQALFVTENVADQIVPYIDAMIKNGSKRSLIGERISLARQAAGLSQEQLAKKLGITQQMVAYLELHPVAIRPELLAKLSVILRVPLEDLLGMDARPKRLSGPPGKMRRLFEAAATLPRSQQQKITALLEAFVAQNSNAQKQAA